MRLIFSFFVLLFLFLGFVAQASDVGDQLALSARGVGGKESR